MAELPSIRFHGRVRLWNDASGGGLAVVDVPDDLVADLGGRRQYRVAGTLSGAAVTGSGMLVAGGGYCIGLSKSSLKAARVGIGDDVELVIARA